MADNTGIEGFLTEPLPAVIRNSFANELKWINDAIDEDKMLIREGNLTDESMRILLDAIVERAQRKAMLECCLAEDRRLQGKIDAEAELANEINKSCLGDGPARAHFAG